MSASNPPPRPPRPPRSHFQKNFDIKADPPRTKQADLRHTDLKVMIDRYKAGQPLPQSREHIKAAFADFTGVTDYMDVLGRVFAAREAFDDLPATVRDHFDNDPSQLVDAWHDPARQDELITLGVLPDPNAPEPVSAPPAAASSAAVPADSEPAAAPEPEVPE